MVLLQDLNHSYTKPMLHGRQTLAKTLHAQINTSGKGQGVACFPY